MHLNSTEFEQWKTKYEQDTDSCFVQSSGVKGSCETYTHYFYCNRSGYFLTQSTGKRHLKSQGTSKMNAHCTATIVATQKEQCIQVRICHTHYGHSKSIGQLKLSKEDRQHIAGKLAQGVTFKNTMMTL